MDSLQSLVEAVEAGEKEGNINETTRLPGSSSNESLASLNGAERVCAEGIPNVDFLGRNDLDSLVLADSGSEISSLGGGEAMCESVAVLAPEILTPARRKDMNQQKPPNVLIYCGKKDSVRLFESVRSTISQCLNPDRYVVYHLKHEQVHTTPWKDNALMLVVASDKVYDGLDKAFLQYFYEGGTVMSFNSVFDAQILDRTPIAKNLGVMSLSFHKWKDVALVQGCHVYNSCHTFAERCIQ